MMETRESLTEKLQIIEDKVADTVHGVTETVQGATSAVAETVETIKGTVAESVDTVKGWFDLPGHVDRHPWLMMGGSMALGYLVESLVHQAMAPSTSHMTAAMSTQSNQPQPSSSRTADLKLHHTGNGHRPKRRQESSGAASSLFKTLAPEFGKLKSLAFGVILGTVREMISRAVPEHMGQQIKQIIDDATRKIGGNPIPGSDWERGSEEERAGAGRRGGEHDRGGHFPRHERDAG